eukprot:CAMPEP_0173418272 /NCGR_PEP_ID=MMETSP1357-20121228/478_1 /TAXON_ID=77926 /ORGANISM="Hemiselmis rufescens, Strain PCC563" /LENGTH=371 /DNA_ID=CAMNT_0014380743 /DNA_START=11 /DNA_END=1127 /DNA_ORIENTATION=-
MAATMKSQPSLFSKMKATGMAKANDRSKGKPARSAASLYQDMLTKQGGASDLNLHTAVDRGSVSLLKDLLNQGSHPIDTLDSAHRTPLHAAAAAGSLEMVELLLERKADPRAESKSNDETPLHVSTDPQVTEAIIRANGNPNHGDAWGLTPLHHAARAGNAEVARVLIQYGATVDLRDGIRRTPLMMAAFGGHQEVVEELASHGADLACKDRGGRTALEMATSMGHREVTKCLREMGEILQQMGDEGKSLRELPAGSAARLQRGNNNQPTQRPPSRSGGAAPSPPQAVAGEGKKGEAEVLDVSGEGDAVVAEMAATASADCARWGRLLRPLGCVARCVSLKRLACLHVGGGVLARRSVRKAGACQLDGATL